AAAEANPPVVETADGKPLDVASILAATDSDIEIQTAGGPGGNQGGHGGDNSGAIFQAFGAGSGGLGGFQGTGAQDGAEGPGSGPGVDGGQINELFARAAVNFAPTVEDVGAKT